MKKGFTLAEVLITMTIIGIVAAVSVPSLLINVQEKAFEGQRRALLARMSSAFGQMKSVGGSINVMFANRETGQVSGDYASKFIIDKLSKVYKIKGICRTNILDCGLPETITTMSGDAVNLPITMHAYNVPKNSATVGRSTVSLDHGGSAFETVNGEKILLLYNPECINRNHNTSNMGVPVTEDSICINMLYDLNGKQGPNTVGKDVGFITVLYRNNPVVVAPEVVGQTSAELMNGNDDPAVRACKEIDENATVPTLEEMASIAFNGPYFDNISSGSYWTNNIITRNGDYLAALIRLGGTTMGGGFHTQGFTSSYEDPSTSHMVVCVSDVGG